MLNNNFFDSAKQWLKSLALPVATVGICLFVLLFSLDNISDANIKQQEKTLRDAITKSAVHCYATQGAYPDNMRYLTEHYGITYDQDKFFVDYQIFASNIMPEITIIKK